MTRRALPVVPTLSLVLALAAAACERKPPPDSPTTIATPRADAPSVLLLTLDTTRADALHCYGAPYVLASPRLDALAAEGVRFSQARTTAPMSLPSHATILTGRWPFETGVRDNTTFRLGEDAATLAERFHAAGYATGAVIASYTLHSIFGLKQGFDAYSDPPSTGLDTFFHQSERTAAQVTDECLRWCDGRPAGAPFFLWAHYFDPHFPYEPPAPFLADFLSRAAPGGKGRARYAGEVAYMDREIGRLLDAVRARMGGRPLIVVAISDHGEGLGDHGEDSHGMMLYDPTARIPFLLAGDGLPRGVVDAPVSTVDLAPTLLDLCGLPRDGVSGVSLVPAMRAAATAGASPPAPSDEVRELATRPLYYETLSPYFGYGWSPLFAVQVGDLMLLEGPHPELYDVVADPGETKSLLDDRPEVARQMRQQFTRWREVAAAAVANAAKRPDLSPEQRERMLELGYAGAFADVNVAVPPPGAFDAARRDPRDGGVIVAKMFEMQMLTGQQKIAPAVAVAEELLRLDAENPMVQQLAGSTLILGGAAARGVELIQKAALRHPDFATRFTLAQGLAQIGRRGEALKLLEELAKEQGDNLRVRLRLGELLIEDGRKTEALPHLEHFLARYPKDDEQRRKATQLLERARAK